MMQVLGNPVYENLTTSQMNVAAIAAALGSDNGVRLLRLTALPANAGPVFYGHSSSVTTSNGVPIPAGAAVILFIDSTAKVFIIGTANDKLAVEVYR